jgi:hypothetical protein
MNYGKNGFYEEEIKQLKATILKLKKIVRKSREDKKFICIKGACHLRWRTL